MGASQGRLPQRTSSVYNVGTANVVAPAGTPGVITTTTTTVPHNLGYTPKAEAFMNNITGAGYGIPLPMWISFGVITGGAFEYFGVMRYMTYAVDGTNFYVITYSSGSIIATNYTITYYLYQQTAL